MASVDYGAALGRQLEYSRILETFLARGVNPRLSSTWGYWTTDARGYTVHAFVVGGGWLGVAAFPSTFEVQLDLSELDPKLIDCLYLYRWNPSTSKHELDLTTDIEGLAQTWQLKRRLMKEYREYRRKLLAGE